MRAQRTKPTPATDTGVSATSVEQLSEMWFSQVSAELSQLRALLLTPPRNELELGRADRAMDRLQSLAEELASRPASTVDQLRTKTALLRDILDEEACGLAFGLVISICRDLEDIAQR